MDAQQLGESFLASKPARRGSDERRESQNSDLSRVLPAVDGNVTHWRLAPLFKPPASKPSTPGVSQARELPTIYKEVTKVEWFRTFPLRQRLAILFGAPLLVVIRIATQHRTGRFQPAIAGLLCKSIDKERALLEHKELIEKMDNMLIDPPK